MSRNGIAVIFAGATMAAVGWMQAMEGDISSMEGEAGRDAAMPMIRHATAGPDDRTSRVEEPVEARPVSPSSFDYALAVCNIFDATNLAARNCEVSGWEASIDMSIDTGPDEARRFCRTAAEQVRLLGLIFDPGWKLNIRSLRADRGEIIFCDLPTRSL